MRRAAKLRTAKGRQMRPMGFSLESESGVDTPGDAERTGSHGHGPHGHGPHGHEPLVPSLQAYPIQVKRPIGSDLTFSFSWAERMLRSLKRLFGEENVFSCLFEPARSVSTPLQRPGDRRVSDANAGGGRSALASRRVGLAGSVFV